MPEDKGYSHVLDLDADPIKDWQEGDQHPRVKVYGGPEALLRQLTEWGMQPGQDLTVEHACASLGFPFPDGLPTEDVICTSCGRTLVKFLPLEDWQTDPMASVPERSFQ